MKLSSPKFILLVSSATYVGYGIFNAGIGPLLGELAAQTGSSLAAIGVIFTALYAGSLLSQLTSGALTDRYGRKPVFAIATGLYGVGILGVLQAHSLTALLGWAFLAGLGQGGIDLGSNLLVADAHPHNRAGALNLLHLSFGLGSTLGPALISLALAVFRRGLPVLGGDAVFLFVALVLAVCMRVKPAPATAEGFPGQSTPSAERPVYFDPRLWLLGGLQLLGVGAEFGIGSWATVYLMKTLGFSLETAAMATAGYWAFITIGRLAAAVMSRFLSSQQMLLVNVSGSLLFGVGLAFAHQAALPTVVFLLATGFCFGGLYPLVIAITTASFPVTAGKASSVVVALGTVGGLTVPVLAGVVMQNAGSREYTWLIAALLGVMLVVEQAAVRNQASAVQFS